MDIIEIEKEFCANIGVEPDQFRRSYHAIANAFKEKKPRWRLDEEYDNMILGIIV